MTGLFPALNNETRAILDSLPGIINKTFPLPARYHRGTSSHQRIAGPGSALSRDVAELSRLLTSAREERSASYLGKPALLSAYLRYFLPWNIYRLCRLLVSLPLDFKSGDAINDLGAGPLTLAASLWISRPELRDIPLEFRCLDRTPAVLSAGKDFFTALTGTVKSASCPWTIKTIRGELKRNGTLSTELRGKPAALSAAVNLYNELFWNFSPLDTEGLERFAEKQARLLSILTENSGSILVTEPGIPRSGEFISIMRAGFLREGRLPLSPCTHHGACALPGSRVKGKAGTGKPKWCHFAFDTNDAPVELHKLSAAANIPKERAVLSFILAGPISPVKEQKNKTDKKNQHPSNIKIRIVSDSFPVSENSQRKKSPGQDLWGRYGCCEKGLVLVTGGRDGVETSPSGALEELRLLDGVRDEKSGALIAHHHY